MAVNEMQSHKAEADLVYVQFCTAEFFVTLTPDVQLHTNLLEGQHQGHDTT